MSAPAPHRSASRPGPRPPLAGTATLLRLALRRDRIRLAVWTVAIGLLVTYTVVALDTLYPSAEQRQARAVLMANPASVMLGGPGFGLDDYTLGAMLANELSASLVVAVAIMTVLLVVRHTRAEEQAGRAELVGSGAVGRLAPLTAALVLAAAADLAIAVLVATGLAAAGLDPLDSVAFALGVGLTGLVFGALAAVAAQVSEHARASTGLALAALAGAAAVRGVGDIVEPGGSALSWFSPIAWTQQTRAYVDLRWWPLLLGVAAVAVATSVAYHLASRRDVGAGLVAPRRGPTGASRALAGPVALAARLQRGSIAGWTVGLALTGLTFGALTGSVAEAVDADPQLAAVFAADAAVSIDLAYLAAVTTYLALGAAAFAVASVLRQRGEEAAGRTEMLLTGAVGRTRLLGGGMLVTAAASATVLAAGGLGAGISAAADTGDSGLVLVMVGAALGYLPAVLVVAALAAALVGFIPRLTWLVWVVLAYVVLVGLFGALLRMPGWLLDASPFTWVPAIPAAAFDPAATAGLTLIAVALVAAALAGFRRRDLVA